MPPPLPPLARFRNITPLLRQPPSCSFRKSFLFTNQTRTIPLLIPLNHISPTLPSSLPTPLPHGTRAFSTTASLRSPQRDHYKTLGVKSTATKKELKAQFYKLSKKYHPDKNPGDSEAHSKFVEINDSYTVLSDVAQRRQHDQYLRSQTPSSSSSPHHPQQRPPRPKNYTTRDPLRPEDWILYRRRNMNNSTTSSPGFDHESHQNEHYGAAADAAEKREQSRQSRLFKTLYYQKLQEAQRIEQKMMMTAAVFGLSIFFIFHSGLIQMIWMDDDDFDHVVEGYRVVGQQEAERENPVPSISSPVIYENVD